MGLIFHKKKPFFGAFLYRTVTVFVLYRICGGSRIQEKKTGLIYLQCACSFPNCAPATHFVRASLLGTPGDHLVTTRILPIALFAIRPKIALFAIRPKIARLASGPKIALFAIRPKIARFSIRGFKKTKVIRYGVIQGENLPKS